MSETFALSSIKPNPFRHMDRYPILEKKVNALKESYETTGFWENLVARIGDDGKPQIAYGHHRLHTLREVYKPGHRISLIIKDLSDDMMLKMMARENMEEWGSSAAIEQETVRAVVEAYAEGLIELGTIPRNISSDQRRYAPGFTPGGRASTSTGAPYTIVQVADYLGWHEKKVRYALGALELINDGALAESDFNDLSSPQAERIVIEARKAQQVNAETAAKQRKAEEAAEKAAKAAEAKREAAEKREQARLKEAANAKAEKAERDAANREAAAAAREAREARAERDRQRAEQQRAKERADKARDDARKQASAAGKQASTGLKGGRGIKDRDLVTPPRGRKNDPPPPHVSKYVITLCNQLDRVMKSDECAQRFNEVLKVRQHLDEQMILDLDHHLGNLADRVAVARNKLGANSRTENVIDAEFIEAEEITA